jgi:hypothetical protein
MIWKLYPWYGTEAYSAESGNELILEISPDEPTTYLLVLPSPNGEEDEREGIIQTTQDLDDLLRPLAGWSENPVSSG